MFDEYLGLGQKVRSRIKRTTTWKLNKKVGQKLQPSVKGTNYTLKLHFEVIFQISPPNQHPSQTLLIQKLFAKNEPSGPVTLCEIM